MKIIYHLKLFIKHPKQSNNLLNVCVVSLRYNSFIDYNCYCFDIKKPFLDSFSFSI